MRALAWTLPHRLLLFATLTALLLALIYAQARTGVAHAATTVNISIMNGVTMSSFKFSPSPRARTSAIRSSGPTTAP